MNVLSEIIEGLTKFGRGSSYCEAMPESIHGKRDDLTVVFKWSHSFSDFELVGVYDEEKGSFVDFKSDRQVEDEAENFVRELNESF